MLRDLNEVRWDFSCSGSAVARGRFTLSWGQALSLQSPLDKL